MSRVAALALLVGLLVAGEARAQAFVYDGALLRDVIEDVERRTAWRFLYADALVATARVRLESEAPSLPDSLARALAPQGIGVDADPERRRILLVPATPVPARASTRIIRGRVLDDDTGEPLPFATVTWDDAQRGVVADEYGAFVVTLSEPRPLRASFVGYGAETASPRGTALTFRLRPEVGTQPAVVVNALTFRAPVDTAWAARLQPGRYDAVGEGGGLRALDVLPSVAPSTLFSDGPVVRGSPSDAFEVRLDGVPVYNPRHLFGLVDAFNGDALRAVALHLGVAPAHVAVAPGGAVDYVTATGSRRAPSADVGVSSLAARAAVAAPLRSGRTTLLVGGRTSVLGAAPWSSDALVEQGLGVLRRTSPLPLGTTEALSRVIDVEHTEASFWDLHLGATDERAGGGRTSATVYLGGDDTRLDASRIQAQEGDDGTFRLVRNDVATENRWGSRAASVFDQRPLSQRVVLHTRLGGSAYDARFAQDDFTFTSDRVNPLLLRIDTLGYDNRLREAIVAQRLDVVTGEGLASGGYSLHLYRQRYEETAAQRAAFVADQAATRLDLHAGWKGRIGAVDLDAGARLHLYSAAGSRLSPRLGARYEVSPHVSVSAALGRSAQFLHRLTLGDAVGAAAWVLSDRAETVTEADLAEATLELRGGAATAQLTGYVKRTRGLWLHREARVLRGIGELTFLQRPWLSDVDGRTRSLEALVRVPVGAWSLGTSAALGRAELRHPALNDGAVFPADWDRRARVTLLADGPLVTGGGSGLRLATAWALASGAPNPLAGFGDEPERLGPLSRLDLRLSATQRWGGATVSLALAVRNLFDADNAFTREATTVLRRNAAGDVRLGLVPLDVYDAGILPTFDLAVRW